MLQALRVPAVLLTAGVLGTTTVQAQSAAPGGAAGSEILTIGAYGGGFSPAADLTSNSGFGNSGTGGGTLTLWVHPNVGVRGNVLFARTEIGSGAPEGLTGEKPNIWAYSGDLVLRLPFDVLNGRDSWFPYLAGGIGGKTYAFDNLNDETDFAGNFGAGVEYRLARWGVQAEVRDIVTSFERFGVNKTQHDVVWTAGITRSF
jgi:hypothetical protein